MPTLHFEHSLLGSQKSWEAVTKNTHHQAPYLHFKNAAPHIPLAPTGLCRAPKPNAALQAAHGCAWCCCHVPEERTGPWSPLSLPLLHQPPVLVQEDKGTLTGTEVEFVRDVT